MTPMRPQRLTRMLVASCVVLVVAGLAAWLVPAYRERAAIAEFEQFGTSVYRYDRGVTYADADLSGNNGNEIHLERGGPEWLRRIVGDEWMHPFDGVTKIHLNFEVGSLDPFSAAGPAEQYQPFSLLRQLRSIELLSVYRELLSESEIDQLRTQFPGLVTETHLNPMTKQMHFFF